MHLTRFVFFKVCQPFFRANSPMKSARVLAPSIGIAL